MNQNTKEQKALEVCRKLDELYKNQTSFMDNKSAELLKLAREALAPDVSKAGLRIAEKFWGIRYTFGPEVEFTTRLARIIDETTHHVELREALVVLWATALTTPWCVNQSVTLKVKEALEATK